MKQGATTPTAARTKPAAAGGDAKARIRATALALFARRGVAGVSLRELTAEAGVNIAAVNYHFGSREGLEEAVFEDIASRVNRQRLDALESVLAAATAADAPPAVEAILETFIEPYLDETPPGQGPLLAQLILRHRVDPSPMTKRLMRSHFDPMAKRYVAALALAQPGIGSDEFVWRYMFMTSAVVLTATDRNRTNRVKTISGGRLDATRRAELKSALLRFLVGGMGAPDAAAPGRR